MSLTSILKKSVLFPLTVVSAINFNSSEAIALEDISSSYLPHRIESGDSVSKIASNYGISRGDVYESNLDYFTKDGEFNPETTLTIGAVLQLPKHKISNENIIDATAPAYFDYFKGLACTDTHTVKSGENTWAIKNKYSLDLSDLINANRGFYTVNGKVRVDKTLSIGDILKIPNMDCEAKENRFESVKTPLDAIEYVLGLSASEVYDIRALDYVFKKNKKKKLLAPKTLASLIQVDVGVGAKGDEKLDNMVLNYNYIFDAAKGQKHLDLNTFLAVIGLESGGYPFATSPSGGLGICQNTYWTYASKKGLSKSERFNPYDMYESLNNCAQTLNDDIEDLGEVLGVLSHYTGRDIMDKGIEFARKQEINIRKNPLDVINLKVKVKDKDGKFVETYFFNQGARDYYNLYKKQKDWIKGIKLFKPENDDLRKNYIDKLENSGVIREVRTVGDLPIRFVPIEATLKRLQQFDNYTQLTASND